MGNLIALVRNSSAKYPLLPSEPNSGSSALVQLERFASSRGQRINFFVNEEGNVVAEGLVRTRFMQNEIEQHATHVVAELGKQFESKIEVK